MKRHKPSLLQLFQLLCIFSVTRCSRSHGSAVKIWYRKKYRYRYRKYLVPEKVSVSVSFNILGTVTHCSNQGYFYHLISFLTLKMLKKVVNERQRTPIYITSILHIYSTFAAQKKTHNMSNRGVTLLQLLISLQKYKYFGKCYRNLVDIISRNPCTNHHLKDCTNTVSVP